jgi:hypothetical protein
MRWDVPPGGSTGGMAKYYRRVIVASGSDVRAAACVQEGCKGDSQPTTRMRASCHITDAHDTHGVESLSEVRNHPDLTAERVAALDPLHCWCTTSVRLVVLVLIVCRVVWVCYIYMLPHDRVLGRAAAYQPLCPAPLVQASS